MRLASCVSILVALSVGMLISTPHYAVPSESFSGFEGPVIESFTAVPDCVYPDPRRHLLSYRVTTNVYRVRIDAIHLGGRVRTFHTAGGRTPWPSLSATGVLDPGATSDIEAYVLTATGERGVEVTRRLAFRYRRAEFNLVPPTFHLHATGGGDYFTRYESQAVTKNIDSISCSFRFDTPVAGESSRAGSADVFLSGSVPFARCAIRWRDARKARAAGTVEWIARVTDSCTQGRITRTAHVNAIP
jgi:hypothetical protein